MLSTEAILSESRQTTNANVRRHYIFRPRWLSWGTVLPQSIQTLCEFHRHVALPNDIIFSIRRLHSSSDRVHAVASDLFTMLFCIPPETSAEIAFFLIPISDAVYQSYFWTKVPDELFIWFWMCVQCPRHTCKDLIHSWANELKAADQVYCFQN